MQLVVRSSWEEVPEAIVNTKGLRLVALLFLAIFAVTAAKSPNLKIGDILVASAHAPQAAITQFDPSPGGSEFIPRMQTGYPSAGAGTAFGYKGS